jgi:hypothetical protein
MLRKNDQRRRDEVGHVQQGDQPPEPQHLAGAFG